MSQDTPQGYRHNPLWDMARADGRKAAALGLTLQDNPLRYHRPAPNTPRKRRALTHWGAWAAKVWDDAFTAAKESRPCPALP